MRAKLGSSDAQQPNEPRSDVVCWTRMQAEAGQDIHSIIRRKELERASGSGLFCWGIGNAPPRSLPEFVRSGTHIDVIFSLMKSRPRAVDTAPDRVVVWRAYYDVDGEQRRLPPNTLITSRAKSRGRPHYALICHTQRKMEITDYGAFDPAAYLNVSAAGRPVGASQVTALLRRVGVEAGETGYRVNFKASLTKSFWVKLADPLELSGRAQARLLEAFQEVRSMGPIDWLRFALNIKEQCRKRQPRPSQQLGLL